MQISATEAQKNFGKYLELSACEDIVITKNGKEVAVLSNIKEHNMNAMRSFKGALKGRNINFESMKEERLSKQCK